MIKNTSAIYDLKWPQKFLKKYVIAKSHTFLSVKMHFWSHCISLKKLINNK